MSTTRLHDAAAHGTGKAAKVKVGSVHPLDREPEGFVLHPFFIDLYSLEIAHQCRTVIPGRRFAPFCDVVAFEGRQRNEGDRVEAQVLGEFREVLTDGAVDLLRVVDQIHLVDRDDHITNPDERHQVAVSTSLREHALARIDHEHGDISRRGAGDHVARVLLVAGRIGHNKFPVIRREVSVSAAAEEPVLPVRRSSPRGFIPACVFPEPRMSLWRARSRRRTGAGMEINEMNADSKLPASVELENYVDCYSGSCKLRGFVNCWCNMLATKFSHGGPDKSSFVNPRMGSAHDNKTGVVTIAVRLRLA
jgi:hypothetical protein